MKLVVASLETLKGYVSREFYYLIQELITHYGWQQVDTAEIWREPGSLEDKFKRRFGGMPETILFWEDYSFISAHAKQLDRMDCYKCVFADDLHAHNALMKSLKTLGFLLCDLILSTYENVFADFYPSIAANKPVIWLPHAASPTFMLPFNERAENAIFLSGAVNAHHYPLRQHMKALHDRGGYPIIYHRHPGYHGLYNYAHDDNIGDGYAKKIHAYRTGFTDCLRYKYAVAKHFEIPATGALLLAESRIAADLKRLGFVENCHYVSVSRDDMKEKIRYVSDEANHTDLDRIRKNGQALVWERHTIGDRARRLDEVCAKDREY